MACAAFQTELKPLAKDWEWKIAAHQNLSLH